jgi:hypothetical protein
MKMEIENKYKKPDIQIVRDGELLLIPTFNNIIDAINNLYTLINHNKVNLVCPCCGARFENGLKCEYCGMDFDLSL